MGREFCVDWFLDSSDVCRLVGGFLEDDLRGCSCDRCWWLRSLADFVFERLLVAGLSLVAYYVIGSTWFSFYFDVGDGRVLRVEVFFACSNAWVEYADGRYCGRVDYDLDVREMEHLVELFGAGLAFKLMPRREVESWSGVKWLEHPVDPWRCIQERETPR